jgi:hypothetical protein
MTDEKHSPMTNEDDEEQHFKLMQKLQAKHDDLFEKIVFAQREDKEDVAQAYALELIAVRDMTHMQKHMYLKFKWKMY